MRWIYNFLINGFQILLPILGLFFKRLKTFRLERQHTNKELENFIAQNQSPIIWVHVASLGEYEQVVPVIKALKPHFKTHQFLLSFFSDSGYRIKKNKSIANFETYLPLDTKSQSQDFVNLIKPQFAIFVKYDIWPNFLRELNKQHIKTFIVAARFRPQQVYFKAYGRFFKQALKSFQHIFVQDQTSGHLLNSINYTSWTHTGDTRYDRVYQQLNQDNKLDFMEDFKENKQCMVCGSTWPEDEKVLLTTLNDKTLKLKFVIAPHQIKTEAIDQFQKQLQKSSIKYSEIKTQDLSQFDVLILDTVGLLTKVYAYADIAYVGGAMGKTGLHNILEPAAFGVPIIIGPNYDKFPEAKALKQKGGLAVVSKTLELQNIVRKLNDEQKFKTKMSKAAYDFVQDKKGATALTCEGILQNLIH
ncbi:3-deoxy-D-manno-octulosonic acid transferase [Flavobacteriaceae bacterium 14752]|uniref:3-deoxy-D-manno-octulosonic acid transferase n=1 Tax=Mesohalobacter salilacus TaxID=2491711 RepID=UPI000F640288|nr:3-deoxy-D-manno-octulosonic acid transferase [Flavobacteriaceae bacterium 14752]